MSFPLAKKHSMAMLPLKIERGKQVLEEKGHSILDVMGLGTDSSAVMNSYLLVILLCPTLVKDSN